MTKLLLVISGEKENYYELFKDVKTIGDYKFQVEQAAWEDLSFSVYTSDLKKNGIILDAYPSRYPIKGSPQEKKRTLQPDFILIRNIVHGNHGYDNRNLLYGLIFSGIPCVNSLDSVLHFLERPVMHSELLKIQKRIGKDNFPLIEQTFYSNFQQMNFHPEFPLVAKVAHVHAGYGKMKVENQEVFNDLSSVLAINNNYITAEPFYKGKYDLRIQCIGDHIRVYKREGFNWKTNTGTAILTDVDITSTYKMWVDEVKKSIKGFDIFAIDVIHTEKDEEYILEVNDCSIGLGPNHAEEDLIKIKNLVLTRMKESFKIPELQKVIKEEKDVEILNLKNCLGNYKETIDQLTEELNVLKKEKKDMREKGKIQKEVQDKLKEEKNSFFFTYATGILFIGIIIFFLYKIFS